LTDPIRKLGTRLCGWPWKEWHNRTSGKVCVVPLTKPHYYLW